MRKDNEFKFSSHANLITKLKKKKTLDIYQCGEHPRLPQAAIYY